MRRKAAAEGRQIALQVATGALGPGACNQQCAQRSRRRSARINFKVSTIVQLVRNGCRASLRRGLDGCNYHSSAPLVLAPSSRPAAGCQAARKRSRLWA